MPRADGPFEVLEHMNDNAYEVDLLGEYGVSAIINVADLSLYLEDDYLVDLRENSSQQGENVGAPSTPPSLGPQDSQGNPIPHTQVHGLVQQMTGPNSGHPGLHVQNKPGFVNLIS